MPKAVWNNTLLAETDKYQMVEGNVYFPSNTINQAHLRPSSLQTYCPWKGTAHYYDVVVDEEVNQNAAWYYPNPKSAAKNITDHVAFWHGVRVEN